MTRSRTIKRFFQKTLPIASILVLILSALYLASGVVTGLTGFGKYYVWVFVMTGIALLVLLVALVNRFVRLIQRLRRSEPGARLTFRWVILFIILAVPPAGIVYGFSIAFVGHSIDSWFDVDVEAALTESQQIAQRFLEFQEIDKQTQTRRLAERLVDIDDSELTPKLRNMLEETNATELSVIRSTGALIRTINQDFAQFEADLPSDYVLLTVRNTGSYIRAEELGEEQIQIRVLETIPDSSFDQSRILQGIFPVIQGFDVQAGRVNKEYDHYTRLLFLRSQLKRSFIIILTLVLVLSVLLALLLAIDTARRLIQPIGNLAEATREIAAGDYHQTLPAAGNDELGFLVTSFNSMSAELARSSAEVNRSRIEAEARRDYLETVLANLSSAVISLDQAGLLRTSNPVASELLGVDLSTYYGQSLKALATDHPDLLALTHLIDTQEQRQHSDWRDDLVLRIHDAERILVCTGVHLRDSTELDIDLVLVIDDATELVQAQKEAAWGEVARRLAHEVRNPLTPIQLAAERLHMKYRSLLPESDVGVLDRSVRTIINQVESLKSMVNAFSEYARTPTLQLTPLSLSVLTAEVCEMYRSGQQINELTMDWVADEPQVLADRSRIVQLLNNLIKNAIEASEPERPSLTLSSRLDLDRDPAMLVMTIEDNGPGLNRDVRDRLFEPYVSTKTKGTGIGLAIVKKIIEEHGGQISFADANSGGAAFTLKFPLAAQTQDQSG